jgi:hypothetical protein
LRGGLGARGERGLADLARPLDEDGFARLANQALDDFIGRAAYVKR